MFISSFLSLLFLSISILFQISFSLPHHSFKFLNTPSHSFNHHHHHLNHHLNHHHRRSILLDHSSNNNNPNSDLDLDLDLDLDSSQFQNLIDNNNPSLIQIEPLSASIDQIESEANQLWQRFLESNNQIDNDNLDDDLNLDHNNNDNHECNKKFYHSQSNNPTNGLSKNKGNDIHHKQINSSESYKNQNAQVQESKTLKDQKTKKNQDPQEVQEAQEAKKDQETKALEYQKNQEAQKAKKDQETKALEYQKDQEAQKAKKDQDAQKAKKDQESKALEYQKDQEAQKIKKDQEAQKAKKDQETKALEYQKDQEAQKAKKDQEAQKAKKSSKTSQNHSDDYSSTPKSDTKTGDATFYATGLGSCGITDNDSNMIVAVSHILYDSYSGGSDNPNNNGICGKQISASYKGKTITVVVHDRCTGCEIFDLDFSPTAFKKLADPDKGRLHGLTWNFI